MPEDPRVEGAEVWSLQPDDPSWGQELSRLAEDGNRIGHVLDQVEHEHEVELLGCVEILESADEAVQPSFSRDPDAIGVYIDYRRGRLPVRLPHELLRYLPRSTPDVENARGGHAK
jgi:hypothetical protein